MNHESSGSGEWQLEREIHSNACKDSNFGSTKGDAEVLTAWESAIKCGCCVSQQAVAWASRPKPPPVGADSAGPPHFTFSRRKLFFLFPHPSQL